MTRGETAMVLVASTLGGILAAARMADVSGSALMTVLAGVMGLDIIGGAVCNGTVTTRYWYHRPGQGWRDHMLFIVPHLAYVGVVAGLARGPGFDVGYASIFAPGILIASAAVITAPARLKTPVAFGGFMVLLVGMTIQFGTTPGLEWFAPGLLLKLLLGHLVGPGAGRLESQGTKA
jgi:hypothetical protein